MLRVVQRLKRRMLEKKCAKLGGEVPLPDLKFSLKSIWARDQSKKKRHQHSYRVPDLLASPSDRNQKGIVRRDCIKEGGGLGELNMEATPCRRRVGRQEGRKKSPSKGQN